MPSASLHRGVHDGLATGAAANATFRVISSAVVAREGWRMGELAGCVRPPPPVAQSPLASANWRRTVRNKSPSQAGAHTAARRAAPSAKAPSRFAGRKHLAKSCKSLLASLSSATAQQALPRTMNVRRRPGEPVPALQSRAHATAPARMQPRESTALKDRGEIATSALGHCPGLRAGWLASPRSDMGCSALGWRQKMHFGAMSLGQKVHRRPQAARQHGAAFLVASC